MSNHYVYILANKKNGTIYVGVTTDLPKRISQHKSKLIEGFTKKYNIDQLVYYEHYEDYELAAKREANIKKWKRAWKLELIEKENSGWNDLYESLFDIWIPALAGMPLGKI
ncbi:MAG: GIY-YIG nuclease [Micavibrio aeruginosavorus]|uniref:GIY-YIG nuclease n=1 Tax=Micavibrio aeruginosavorus TaxID=349221 RepID=A0A2W5FFZ3_9BACT|nr:MAG: GIY-YIG nuclease [Micavibrio aeruginosavorus]